ncbi:MAG: hypothetical protein ACRDKS_00760 [Actinomycetota bacterium]
MKQDTDRRRAVFEWAAVGGSLAAAVTLAIAGVWVFDPRTAPAGSSIWHVILRDRVTLGLVRLLVGAIAVYAVASVAVSVVRGRWMRSITTSGIEVEPASEGALVAKVLEEKLRRAQSERDEANRLLEECLRG